MGSAVKKHVLKIMGQSPLILCFIQGSCLDIEIHANPVFRFLVGHNNVAQPIFQGAEHQGWIRLEITVIMWPATGDTVRRLGRFLLCRLLTGTAGQ